MDSKLPMERVAEQRLALPMAKDPVYIWRDALAQPVWMGGMIMLRSDEAACDYMINGLPGKMGAVFTERVIGWRTKPTGAGGWEPVSKMLARATPEGWVPM